MSRGSWVDDHRRLSGSDPAALSAGELEALADAAWLLCRLEESTRTRQQAYAQYLEAHQDGPAARTAWRLFWEHLYGGQAVVAMGWLRRARRHLAALPEEAEHGFVALADAELALNEGALDEAEAHAVRAVEIGDRHGAQGIVALGLTLHGRILVAGGRREDGCTAMDEAMTLVLSNQLDDFFAGSVYCTVIAECHALADIGRGSAWTDAARAWCASLPATTPYHGICRVHRGEILCLRGAWDDAEAEIRTAGDELAAFKPRSAAEAFAALGELCRRRGDFAGAEHAFRRAHELGGEPQPGLALVRLAQGHGAAASSAVRGALADTSQTPLQRARLLAAQVEVALATDDLAIARDAARELCSIADALNLPALRARACLSCGAVRLAHADPDRALDDLRAACAIWCDLGLPYEEAQTRVLLGLAAREVGDDEGARLELGAACSGFERLGAAAELRRASAQLVRPRRPAGLSAREVEVLRLVAAGRTNRGIADELVISRHTVDRHVQNIFTKLGVSSRAAATAFAVEHHIA